MNIHVHNVCLQSVYCRISSLSFVVDDNTNNRMYIWCIYLPFVAYVLGLPTVFHIFAHTVPVEERSRAFGYLVAAGSVGQTVAALVRICIKPHINAICLIIAQAIKTRIAC